MLFSKDKVAFGRHESFGLRYGWLTKGYIEFEKDNKVFEKDDATVTLGVGRNMVKSIKYWLHASKLVERSNGKSLVPTGIGQLFFSDNGYDKYIEDEATVWLIHWLLATNPQYATVFYWFFNCYHRSEFTVEEASNSLKDFVSNKCSNNFAPKTLHQDLLVLLKMYSNSKEKSRHEKFKELESPLSALNLVNYFEDIKSYGSKIHKRENLPICVFGFALFQIFKVLDAREIPLEKLIYSQDGVETIGTIFRLSENGFLYHLDRLTKAYPEVFSYNESAGLRQVYLVDKDFDYIEFFEDHYSQAT
jgi:hypothetical protein